MGFAGGPAPTSPPAVPRAVHRAVTPSPLRGGVSKAQARSGYVMMDAAATAKQAAGYKAVDDAVAEFYAGKDKSEKIVFGLGTGSTAVFAVERIKQLLASKELTNVDAYATSEVTYELAMSPDDQTGQTWSGSTLTSCPAVAINVLDQKLETFPGNPKNGNRPGPPNCPQVDFAIDGADTVDTAFNLVKGGGGAHLREKMVEMCSKKFIVIVDDSKLCDDSALSKCNGGECKGFGPHFPIPVEVNKPKLEGNGWADWSSTVRKSLNDIPGLPEFGARIRADPKNASPPKGDAIADGKWAVTDNDNYIVDFYFESPLQPDQITGLAAIFEKVDGFVEHGIFQLPAWKAHTDF